MAKQSEIRYLTPLSVDIKKRNTADSKEWYQVYRLQRP